jgi:hypothetical protein
MGEPNDRELSFDPRTWLVDEDDDPPPPPEPRNEARARALLATVAGTAILLAGAAAAYVTRDAPQPIGAAAARSR